MKHEQAPATAFLFGDGTIEVRDNGEGGKSFPFRMVARSAEPINHWYFGKISHDLSGMSISGGKSRVVIDYNHDDTIQLGYANHFSVTDEGLILSGALVPSEYDKDNHAARIAELAQAGIPYEASIHFTDAEMEYVDAGEETTCNGKPFVGPGYIARKWTLRSSAICPSGCDPNTSTALNDKAPLVSFSILNQEESAEMATDKPTATMADQDVTNKLTAAEAVAETPADVVEDAAQEAPVDAIDVDLDSEEAAVEETAAVDTQETPAESTPAETQLLAIQRAAESFGPRGVMGILDGKTYEQVASEIFAENAEEIRQLRAQVAAATSKVSSEPATFSQPNEKPDETLAEGLLPIRLRD